jgi:hypothetical protein
MRRLLILAAFLLIISLVPVCAQRGGHASGGSHGSVGGGHAFSGSHGSVGGHGFAGHSYVSHGSTGTRFGGTRVASSGARFAGRGERFGGGRGDHFRRGRFGPYRYGNCYGYGCWGYGYPFYAYGGIDPNWWWDSYSSNDADDADERAEANEMNEENLREQQMLREQDHQAYARSSSRPQIPASRAPERDERAQAEPATVLIFRDQHQREIQNYAIVDEMLWIFTPQRTEKVPLAVLDMPATIKANEDRGVEFHLPESSQGQ